MDVVDVIRFFGFSNQSLAVELLIAFPIRLRIAPAGRRKPVPAGSSPLAVVNKNFQLSHPYIYVSS